MKRNLEGMIVGAVCLLTVAAGAVTAFASENRGCGPRAASCPREICSVFQDENGDGVCDNAGTCAHREVRRAFVDENGDGVCDNSGTCARRAYVDENGDGICDNAGENGCGASGARGNRQGQGGHHGRRGGHCR